MKYILTVCIVLNIYFLYKNIRKAKELKKEKEQLFLIAVLFLL